MADSNVKLESILPSILAIVIAVIIVGAVLIPIISSTTTVEKENSGYSFRATGEYGDYIYEWDSDSKDLMLNGERLIIIQMIYHG